MFKMGCMARKILAPGSSSNENSAADSAAGGGGKKNKKDKHQQQGQQQQPPMPPNQAGGQKPPSTDELGDFSKLEDDPRLPLNKRQIFKITKSWKAIARTMSKTGTAMFLNLFEQNKDLLYLFDRFQHLKQPELHDSMELREHAATVMSTLDQSINSLSDYDNFVTYLHSIGQLHRKVPGFKRDFFWKIEQPFMKAVKQTLDERCNETIEEIYKISIKLIIETIADGYGFDPLESSSEAGRAKQAPPPSDGGGGGNADSQPHSKSTEPQMNLKGTDKPHYTRSGADSSLGGGDGSNGGRVAGNMRSLAPASAATPMNEAGRGETRRTSSKKEKKELSSVEEAAEAEAGTSTLTTCPSAGACFRDEPNEIVRACCGSSGPGCCDCCLARKNNNNNNSTRAYLLLQATTRAGQGPKLGAHRDSSSSSKRRNETPETAAAASLSVAMEANPKRAQSKDGAGRSRGASEAVAPEAAAAEKEKTSQMERQARMLLERLLETLAGAKKSSSNFEAPSGGNKVLPPCDDSNHTTKTTAKSTQSDPNKEERQQQQQQQHLARMLGLLFALRQERGTKAAKARRHLTRRRPREEGEEDQEEEEEEGEDEEDGELGIEKACAGPACQTRRQLGLAALPARRPVRA